MSIKNNKVRLLLSSPTRPFGDQYGDSFSCVPDCMFSMQAVQNDFRINQITTHEVLDLIARNIHAPTTVLHYPTYRQFVREVKKQYEYVGLTCNLSTLHKIKRQVEAVRRYSPLSKIILGGYGTILPDEELKDLCDYICRGDGISFMRHLLGEEHNDIRMPDITTRTKVFRCVSYEKNATIFASVGCPEGCDFCITSHFFKRKKIDFIKTGKELFESLLVRYNKDKNISLFMIHDEDFLLNKKRALEYLACVRETKMCFELYISASIKSIAQYDVSDLAEMGIRIIMVGFEGLYADYAKLQGNDFSDIVTRLRTYGIGIIPGMLLGLDYQTDDIIEEEFSYLMKLKPFMFFLTILIPCYGTELWNRINSENRWMDLRYDYRRYDGLTLLYSHKHFDQTTLRMKQAALSRKEYDELGPSIYRYFYLLYLAYMKFKASKSDLLNKRAYILRKKLKKNLIFYRMGILYAQSSAIKKQLKNEYAEIVREVGGLGLYGIGKSYCMIFFYFYGKICDYFSLVIQPKCTKKVFNRRKL